jgi:hypothetical protein
MPIPEAAATLEQEIVHMKAELGRMTRSRNLALREGRRDEGERHHLSALEAEIRHVEALSRYVKTVSPAAGRELATRQALAAQHFRRLREAGDLRELNRWVAQELAPLLNKSEQAAHLVATSVRAKSKGSPTAFAWPVAVERAVRDAGSRHSPAPRKKVP